MKENIVRWLQYRDYDAVLQNALEKTLQQKFQLTLGAKPREEILELVSAAIDCRQGMVSIDDDGSYAFKGLLTMFSEQIQMHLIRNAALAMEPLAKDFNGIDELQYLLSGVYLGEGNRSNGESSILLTALLDGAEEVFISLWDCLDEPYRVASLLFADANGCTIRDAARLLADQTISNHLEIYAADAARDGGLPEDPAVLPVDATGENPDTFETNEQ